MFLAFLGPLFGGVFSRIARFVGGLNLYQLGCITLGVFVLIQHFELVHCRHHAAKVEAQAAKAKLASDAALGRMAGEINDHAARTAAKQAEVVITARRVHDHIVYIDRIAKRIEAAPLAGNCKTSTAILEADL